MKKIIHVRMYMCHVIPTHICEEEKVIIILNGIRHYEAYTVKMDEITHSLLYIMEY